MTPTTPDVLIVYWTMTNNTRIMADLIADGVKQAGGAPKVCQVNEITPAEALAAPKLALGCPAMGAEELEPTQFAPFWQSLLPGLSGKSLLLFGSYGWGGGIWLDKWQQEAEAAGANVWRTLPLPGRPDEEAQMQTCEDTGAGFARL